MAVATGLWLSQISLLFAALPCALRCQCVRDAGSIYRKVMKHNGKMPVLKKPVAIWNNQNYGAICSAVGRVHGVTLNWENTVQQKCLSLNHLRIPRCSRRESTSKNLCFYLNLNLRNCKHIKEALGCSQEPLLCVWEKLGKQGR